MYDEKFIGDIIKRMITCSDLGIRITRKMNYYEIQLDETNKEFITLLEKNNMGFRSKVFGSFIDSLNYIDFIINKCESKSLLEIFDNNNEDFDHSLLFERKENLAIWAKKIGYSELGGIL